MKNINIPKNAAYIIDRITGAGYEAYIVGGCVRDSIMGITPKDWDITTSALPQRIKELFPHTVDTGIKHGTVTVVCDKENYEVTTYRIDGEYTDFRHPKEVEFTKELKEDLCRRDFTVNAIAYSSKSGYADFFDGMGDIEKKIIKGVGDPSKRFHEDALRMLRAVRFSAQLDFAVEENTFNAIKQNVHLIKNISAERIRDELFKLIMSDDPQKISMLKESGISEYIFPEINMLDEGKFDIIQKALKRSKKDLPERLSIIFRFLGESTALSTLKRLKTDNKTIKQVTECVKLCNIPLKDDIRLTRYNLSKYGEDTFKRALNTLFEIEYVCGNLIMCKTYDNIYDEIEETISKGHCYSLKTLAINGNTLKNMGITDGKKIGEILNKALQYVLDNPNENKEEILMKIVSREKILHNKEEI